MPVCCFVSSCLFCLTLLGPNKNARCAEGEFCFFFFLWFWMLLILRHAPQHGQRSRRAERRKCRFQFQFQFQFQCGRRYRARPALHLGTPSCRRRAGRGGHVFWDTTRAAPNLSAGTRKSEVLPRQPGMSASLHSPQQRCLVLFIHRHNAVDQTNVTVRYSGIPPQPA